jgi:hypothetical protein
MKKVAIVLAVSVAAAGAAFAGPKDKVGEALVNPSSIAGSASWKNATVAGKVKSTKCKYQIGAKANPTTDLADGPVVCFAEADVRSAFLGPDPVGNSVVVAGEALGGKLKMKGDLRSIGCGTALGSPAISFNGTTICFGTDLGSFDWQSECTSAGMVPFLANVLPGTESYNAGNIVGICQGTIGNGGERIPRPAVPVLAEQGTYNPLL